MTGKSRSGELHHFAKLTEAQVIEARRMKREGYRTKVIWQRVAPTISYDTMMSVLLGRSWKHLLHGNE